MSEPAHPAGATPIPLDYAPDPRGQRWRKRIVRGMVALILAGSVWAVYANRQEISLRVRRWYWARQCLAHVTPPGTVLLEYDRAKVANNSDYMIDANPGMFAPFPYASSPPSFRLPNPPAGYMPQVWREFARLDPRSANFEPAPSSPSPIIFLGERRTPGGKRRLVVVTGGNVNALEFDHTISRLVLPVPSLFEKPTQPTGGLLVVGYSNSSNRYVHSTLEPGVADPNDPTHVTINFEIQAQSTEKPARKSTLDVHLSDSDTLDITLRDPEVVKGL